MHSGAFAALLAHKGRKLSLHVHVPAPPDVGLTFVVDEVGGDRQFDATVIREGVFVPGIGNAGAERIFFPREVLARIAPTFEGRPVNLEHSRTVLDEVGAMTQMRMDDEAVRVRSTLVIQKKRPRYMDAIGFIEARQAAGQVPNVSVELDDVVVRPARPDEKDRYDFVLVDAVGTGVAILPNGACSDKAGCGIGLTAAKTLGLETSYRGVTEKAGDEFGGHVHEFTAGFWRDGKGKKQPYLYTDQHTDPATGVTHSHQWASPTETTEDAGHRHTITLPTELGLAAGDGEEVQVLALQGVDTGEPKMCKEQEAQLAALQAKFQALESTHAQTQKDLAVKSGEVTALKADLSAVQETVQAMEAADLKALRETVEAAAPKGVDAKTVLGENPTKEELLVALKAWKSVPKPPQGGAGATPTGRATAATTRSRDGTAGVKLSAKDLEAREVALKSRYEGLGLGDPAKSKLPKQMQANTRKVVAGIPDDAASEGAGQE